MKLLCGLAMLMSITTLARAAEENDPALFDIGPAATVLLELASPPKLGEEDILKEYDAALLGVLGFRSITMATKPVSVNIGGLEWTVARGTPLFMIRRFTGGELSALAPTAKVYCVPEKDHAWKPKDVKLASAEEKARKARFNKKTQLCLLDAEGDGNFEKAFLKGLKKAEDNVSVEIAPMSYSEVKNVAFPKGSYAAILFHHQNALHTPRFYAEIYDKGTRIYLAKLEMPASADSADFISVPISQNVTKSNLPQVMNFGPASFTILAIDSKAKTATIRREKNWGWVPLEITVTVYGSD